MSTNGLATVPQAREVIRFDAAQRQIIRDMYARDASDAEFATLMTVAEARGLDPRHGQCHFVKRWDSKLGREVWACQISIDGLRGQAESTGDYDGQDEPEFITDAKGVIVAARVRVYRKSITRPFVGVAYFDEYVQTKKDGTPTQFWSKMRRTMLGKCGEALAIRKAFPHTAGLYTSEEMAQAENERPERASVEHVMPRELPEPTMAAQSREHQRSGAEYYADDVAAYLAQIAAATLDDLKRLATAIKKEPAEVQAALRGPYTARRAELTPKPPTGGGAPKPEAQTVTATEAPDPERAAIESEDASVSAQASATPDLVRDPLAWAVHLAGEPNEHAVASAWIKREAAFKIACVRDDRWTQTVAELTRRDVTDPAAFVTAAESRRTRKAA